MAAWEKERELSSSSLSSLQTILEKIVEEKDQLEMKYEMMKHEVSQRDEKLALLMENEEKLRGDILKYQQDFIEQNKCLDEYVKSVNEKTTAEKKLQDELSEKNREFDEYFVALKEEQEKQMEVKMMEWREQEAVLKQNYASLLAQMNAITDTLTKQNTKEREEHAQHILMLQQKVTEEQTHIALLEKSFAQKMSEWSEYANKFSQAEKVVSEMTTLLDEVQKREEENKKRADMANNKYAEKIAEWAEQRDKLKARDEEKKHIKPRHHRRGSSVTITPSLELVCPLPPAHIHTLFSRSTDEK